MARVLKGSHSYTCTRCVDNLKYLQVSIQTTSAVPDLSSSHDFYGRRGVTVTFDCETEPVLPGIGAFLGEDCCQTVSSRAGTETIKLTRNQQQSGLRWPL